VCVSLFDHLISNLRALAHLVIPWITFFAPSDMESNVFEREVCGEGGFLAVLVADRVDVSSCEIGVLIGFKGTS